MKPWIWFSKPLDRHPKRPIHLALLAALSEKILNTLVLGKMTQVTTRADIYEFTKKRLKNG